MRKIIDFFKRIKYNSPVILTFALISFLTWLLALLTQGSALSPAEGWTNIHLFSVYRSSMTDPLTYFRFFGHVLGHVSFEHYLNNFLLILLLGPMLEEKYGSGKLAVMIVVTAFITGAASFIIFPSRMILGASGIAFMLILLSSYVNIQKGRIPLTLILCVVIFIGREIFSGIFEQNDIANLSHIIGGACGAVFGYFIKMSHPDASGEVSV